MLVVDQKKGQTLGMSDASSFTKDWLAIAWHHNFLHVVASEALAFYALQAYGEPEDRVLHGREAADCCKNRPQGHC